MNDPSPQRQRPGLFSLEGLLGAFGLFSLGAGLWRGELMPVFWGLVILGGLVLLAMVRRRDWQQHWQAQERQQRTPPAENAADPSDRPDPAAPERRSDDV